MTLKRKARGLIAAGVLVVAIAAIMVGATPASAKQKRFTLHLAEHRGSTPCVATVDGDGDGAFDFSGGDLVLENRCDVRDPSGNTIGEYSTVVTVLGESEVGPSAFIDCVVTLNDGSKLSFSGPGNFADVQSPSGIDLVVTGGTKKNAGVGGEVNIVHMPGSPATAVFNLTRH